MIRASQAAKALKTDLYTSSNGGITHMLIIKGKSVSGHIAIGPLYLFRRKDLNVTRTTTENPELEIERFHTAQKAAAEHLKKLYEEAVIHVGKDNAAIFEIHRAMLQDPDYLESIEGIIRTQKVNAEYAVSQTSKNFSHIFSSGKDSYMQARVTDMIDISNTIIQCLNSRADLMDESGSSCIIAADDLAPSETVQLNKDKVIGFVTAGGNPSSHTAILARTLGIPAVVGTGAEIEDICDGKLAVIDGFTGTVYIDPDPETLSRMKARQEEEEKLHDLLSKLRGLPSQTLDGTSVELAANISNAGDIAAVMRNDAEGIGLFRSEFIYMGSDRYPAEDTQFESYKLAVETMAGKRVIIRTLDIGADKQAPYFELDKEENPAMGMRAIRICLTRPEIFKVQLRAILRASAFGKTAIMFPMITSVWEVWKAKEILEEVKSSLDREKIPFDHHIETGIMVETPAAALISDKLAKEVDFFSIGTNDLSQYTLAIDRSSPHLDSFFNPHHPAVLKLIRMTVENAHQAGIWAGICGELAADTELTETFLRMGVDELSVSPSSILPVRQKIRSLDLKKS